MKEVKGTVRRDWQGEKGRLATPAKAGPLVMVYGRGSSGRREGEKRNVLILLLAQMFLVSGSFSLEGAQTTSNACRCHSSAGLAAH
jgi:hypothetical protein